MLRQICLREIAPNNPEFAQSWGFIFIGKPIGSQCSIERQGFLGGWQ
jgi:hypothetical protein